MTKELLGIPLDIFDELPFGTEVYYHAVKPTLANLFTSCEVNRYLSDGQIHKCRYMGRRNGNNGSVILEFCGDVPAYGRNGHWAHTVMHPEDQVNEDFLKFLSSNKKYTDPGEDVLCPFFTTHRQCVYRHLFESTIDDKDYWE